jgi:hypothetical protein
MRKTILLVVAVAALVVPVAALADASTPAPSSVASQMCSQLKTSMGANFAATYGTNANKANAFGQCVAKQTKTAVRTVDNALRLCKAEQAKDPAAFDSKYGTNGKPGTKGANQNALGKCVSAAVKKTTTTQTHVIANAAKSCKAALKANAADFAGKYGTKADAFGKCVAALSKTK